jgi:transcriptional regulator with XRE-family HTH domain
MVSIMDYVRECLAANLKTRRAIMRISQENLADMAGLSPGFIANLETGRSYPSSTSLFKLSQALKVGHWKLLEDPRINEISYTREEVSMFLDRAKADMLGDMTKNYTAPRNLLNKDENTKPKN